MTTGKPDDIGQDVWEASFRSLGYVAEPPIGRGMIEGVARAILAERERCAAVGSSLADDIEKSADELRGNMRDYRLHRVAGIRHAVSILRNPSAFAERAAAIRKGAQ